jgi:hypothetical protein
MLFSTQMRRLLLIAAAATLLAQKPWREFPAFEYNSFPIPPDYQEKTEFVFGRLMYPNASFGGRGFGRRFGGFSDWRQGGRGIFWTMDYPRSDRHLMLALRRLTRVHARSVEEPVNLEDGEQFNWPWLYGVEVGHWDLGDDLSKKLREYLLRGGFLMVDDFHGTVEWEVFMQSMRKVFPDRDVVDLDDKDQIFHSIYDLDDRYQVPGASPWFGRGQTYEQDGYRATWRGIYDDHQRLMVAICHNMDLGDSWEHADNPQYPEKFSALGIRIATNYIVYAMTH